MMQTGWPRASGFICFCAQNIELPGTFEESSATKPGLAVVGVKDAAGVCWPDFVLVGGAAETCQQGPAALSGAAEAGQLAAAVLDMMVCGILEYKK